MMITLYLKVSISRWKNVFLKEVFEQTSLRAYYLFILIRLFPTQLWKIWCFFFIYTSIEFNIEWEVREQKEVYVRGERKETKFFVTFVQYFLKYFQIEKLFECLLISTNTFILILKQKWLVAMETVVYIFKSFGCLGCMKSLRSFKILQI